MALRPLMFILILVLAATGLSPAAGAIDPPKDRGERPPGAHIPPPLHLQFEIGPEAIRCRATLYTENFEAWWKAKGETASKLEGEEKAALQRAILAKLERWMSVRVDGLRVPPTLEAIAHIPGTKISDFIAFNQLGLVYPVKGLPQRVEYEWLDWKFLDDEGIPDLPVVIATKGDPELATFKLNEDERGTAWQAPRSDQSDALRGRSIPQPPKQGISVPFASLALILMALVATLLTTFRALGRRPGWRVAFATAALAALVWPLAPGGSTRIRPPWVERVELPDEVAATEVFTTLHRNIYRAFDYDEDGRIYDVLAQSIDGPLLDAMFKEVYESLVMREHGGARAKVSSVKMLRAEVRYPDPDHAHFEVNCHWRVQGRVEHWGHEHLRTNEYQATYGLLRTEGKWKIASLDLEDQKRWGPDVGVYNR